ncbi:MAG: hypothetical protein HY652_09385 [Acidobacteria bacterium]|nr:hypothetical protein [Acidobacteriota bacterium]
MAEGPRRGTLTLGILLIAVGLLFLWQNLFGSFSVWALMVRYWPVLLILLGARMMIRYFL